MRGLIGKLLIWGVMVVMGCWTVVFAKPLQIDHHDITLRLMLSSHELIGVDRMWVTVVGMPDMTFLLHQDFEVDRVEVEGDDVRFEVLKPVGARDVGLVPLKEYKEYYSRAQGIRVEVPETVPVRNELAVNICYHGVMYDTVSASEFSRMSIKNQTIGLVAEEGVFLTPSGIYYPTVPEGMSVYRMSVYLPSPYECVTQGRRAQRFESEDTTLTVWEAMHPSDGIHLVAGKYIVGEYDHGDIKIYTFLFPGDEWFAGQYVPVIREWLDIHSERIGPYPFPKFALVENFFETGYGMPSYTVLGPTVMNMEFVMHGSLPHEILHNWWGNGVFVDYAEGNWCEGLTTYMSNYYLRELEGLEAARDYRRNVCRDYASYVDEKGDYPLVEFTERIEAGDRAIGYGKSMMVFHGLRMMLGDDSFMEALRHIYREKAFQKATWNDFREAFAWVAGEDLDWYFDQWVRRGGAPQLSLGEVSQAIDGPMYKVTAEIIQTPPVFRLQVPVVVTTDKEVFRSTFSVSQDRQIVTMGVDGVPVRLEVDPDFDVFRRLDALEMPPLVSRVYGDKSLVAVLPSDAPGALSVAYRDVADLLNRTGEVTIVEDTELTEAQMQENSLFLLGSPEENTVYARLDLLEERFEFTAGGLVVGDAVYVDPNVAVAVVTDHPARLEKIVAFLYGASAESIRNAGRKLPHYGKYSWVTFRGVERWDRGTWDAKHSPLRYDF